MDQKPEKQSSSSGDWNISDLYSRAWEVVKKNKILWILGAAAGLGSSYNFRSNFNSNNFEKIFSNPNTPNHTDLPNQISAVLGASTNKPFTDAIFNLFSSVPLGWYFLGALELILIVILGLVISTIYNAWSQGMLVQATSTALADKKITLAETGRQVLPKIKSLLWIYIVPGLILFLLIFAAIFVIVLGVGLVPFPAKIILIIIAVVALGAAIYWAIFLTASLIWAPREILLNQKSGKESLIAGYKITKKKLWPSLLLGIVNNILAAVVFFVPILILGAVVVGGVIAGVKSPSLTPLLIGVGIIAGIPSLIGLAVLGGIIGSFKAVVWTNAYLNIKGKYDH